MVEPGSGGSSKKAPKLPYVSFAQLVSSALTEFTASVSGKPALSSI
jgi:hypothetical protein